MIKPGAREVPWVGSGARRGWIGYLLLRMIPNAVIISTF